MWNHHAEVRDRGCHLRMHNLAHAPSQLLVVMPALCRPYTDVSYPRTCPLSCKNLLSSLIGHDP